MEPHCTVLAIPLNQDAQGVLVTALLPPGAGWWSRNNTSMSSRCQAWLCPFPTL